MKIILNFLLLCFAIHQASCGSGTYAPPTEDEINNLALEIVKQYEQFDATISKIQIVIKALVPEIAADIEEARKNTSDIEILKELDLTLDFVSSNVTSDRAKRQLGWNLPAGINCKNVAQALANAQAQLAALNNKINNWKNQINDLIAKIQKYKKWGWLFRKIVQALENLLNWVIQQLNAAQNLLNNLINFINQLQAFLAWCIQQ
jgi:chromosome segregation ATPase